MNPLQKYFRQPKIYISLPSKGSYYPDGSLDGDVNNFPVCAMTGMDEIIMKTPDALFNGDATIKLIESCCPYIKNAKYIPIIDVDIILAAIRLATFGDKLDFSYVCKSCGSRNEYELAAQMIIDHFVNKVFNSTLQIDDLLIQFKPLSYNDVTKFNIENFSLQQTLKQLSSIEKYEDKQKHIEKLYTQMAMIQSNVFTLSIESITVDGNMVTDSDHIENWIKGCDRNYYLAIKDHVEKNRIEWSVPKTIVNCTECGSTEETEIVLDQSHFFE